MNDKLKNYATAPDSEVWEKIEKTMRHRVVRRRAWMAAAGVAVATLAVVGVVLWTGSTNDSATLSAMPDVAQVLPREQVCTTPASQEPIATEMVKSQTRTTDSKPLKIEQPTTVVSSPQMPKALSEERTVVAQKAESSQSVSPAVTVAPAQVVSTVPVTVVGEPQSDNEPVTTVTEPAKQQAKSSTNYGLEDTILWLPNVFVPGSDDDEINTFRVRLNHPGDVLTNFKMTIFSRSGNQVFTSNDINNAWDGTHRGRELPQAAYVYVIYYTDKDGFRHQRKGTVTLVR